MLYYNNPLNVITSSRYRNNKYIVQLLYNIRYILEGMQLAPCKHTKIT